jgi:hypothetical protein
VFEDDSYSAVSGFPSSKCHPHTLQTGLVSMLTIFGCLHRWQVSSDKASHRSKPPGSPAQENEGPLSGKRDPPQPSQAVQYCGHLAIQTRAAWIASAFAACIELISRSISASHSAYCLSSSSVNFTNTLDNGRVAAEISFFVSHCPMSTFQTGLR